ncbi:MAG: UDP-N-acetylmuramate dehydrogenase [Desulfitobacteriaceae bacterium]
MILDGHKGRVERNYPLKNLTTWKIGGLAEYAYWPETSEDLVAVYREAKAEGIELCLIGRGSNLLVSDRGLPGITIVTTGLKDISWGEYTVRTGAGYSLARLAQEVGERGWSGLEFARGIPGTVGGAVIMNAGAHGGMIGERILRLKVLQRGKVRVLDKRELSFGYRESSLREQEWVLEAELSFLQGDREDILNSMRENLRKRAINQPLEMPNAGSVFRNPPGDFAARLIEVAGWKGKRRGGAQVSEKHSNFIVNTGGATAVEILSLIQAIQKDVQDKFGIDLQPEIRYIAPIEEGAGL